MTTTKKDTRAYRATAILDLRGVSDAPEAVVDRLKDTFKGLGAKVGEVTNLGQRDFTRVVDRKFPAGIYAYAQALDNQQNIDSEALTKTLVEVESDTSTTPSTYKVKKLYTQPIPLGQ